MSESLRQLHSDANHSAVHPPQARNRAPRECSISKRLSRGTWMVLLLRSRHQKPNSKKMHAYTRVLHSGKIEAKTNMSSNGRRNEGGYTNSFSCARSSLGFRTLRLSLSAALPFPLPFKISPSTILFFSLLRCSPLLSSLPSPFLSSPLPSSAFVYSPFLSSPLLLKVLLASFLFPSPSTFPHYRPTLPF